MILVLYERSAATACLPSGRMGGKVGGWVARRPVVLGGLPCGWLRRQWRLVRENISCVLG